jgi:hypothetical protein
LSSRALPGRCLRLPVEVHLFLVPDSPSTLHRLTTASGRRNPLPCTDAPMLEIGGLAGFSQYAARPREIVACEPTAPMRNRLSRFGFSNRDIRYRVLLSALKSARERPSWRTEWATKCFSRSSPSRFKRSASPCERGGRGLFAGWHGSFPPASERS